jgi:hypothetical protein
MDQPRRVPVDDSTAIGPINTVWPRRSSHLPGDEDRALRYSVQMLAVSSLREAFPEGGLWVGTRWIRRDNVT